MAKNMLDWFTILAFYETSDHKLDGETLLVIKHRALNRLRFLGKLIDGNKSQWIYRLFEKTYLKFNQIQHEHQAKSEWLDSWKVEINPDHRTGASVFISLAVRSPDMPRHTATRICQRSEEIHYLLILMSDNPSQYILSAYFTRCQVKNSSTQFLLRI